MIIIAVASLIAVLACLHEIGELNDEVEMLNRQVADLQNKAIVLSDGDAGCIECNNIINGRFEHEQG